MNTLTCSKTQVTENPPACNRRTHSYGRPAPLTQHTTPLLHSPQCTNSTPLHSPQCTYSTPLHAPQCTYTQHLCPQILGALSFQLLHGRSGRCVRPTSTSFQTPTLQSKLHHAQHATQHSQRIVKVEAPGRSKSSFIKDHGLATWFTSSSHIHPPPTHASTHLHMPSTHTQQIHITSCNTTTPLAQTLHHTTQTYAHIHRTTPNEILRNVCPYTTVENMSWERLS